MECPTCGATLPEDVQTCPSCNEVVVEEIAEKAVEKDANSLACPSCGNFLDLGTKICPFCATDLSDLDDPSGAPNTPYDGAVGSGGDYFRYGGNEACDDFLDKMDAVKGHLNDARDDLAMGVYTEDANGNPHYNGGSASDILIKYSGRPTSKGKILYVHNEYMDDDDMNDSKFYLTTINGTKKTLDNGIEDFFSDSLSIDGIQKVVDLNSRIENQYINVIGTYRSAIEPYTKVDEWFKKRFNPSNYLMEVEDVANVYDDNARLRSGVQELTINGETRYYEKGLEIPNFKDWKNLLQSQSIIPVTECHSLKDIDLLDYETIHKEYIENYVFLSDRTDENGNLMYYDSAQVMIDQSVFNDLYGLDETGENWQQLADVGKMIFSNETYVPTRERAEIFKQYLGAATSLSERQTIMNQMNTLDPKSRDYHELGKLLHTIKEEEERIYDTVEKFYKDQIDQNARRLNSINNSIDYLLDDFFGIGIPYQLGDLEFVLENFFGEVPVSYQCATLIIRLEEIRREIEGEKNATKRENLEKERGKIADQLALLSGKRDNPNLQPNVNNYYGDEECDYIENVLGNIKRLTKLYSSRATYLENDYRLRFSSNEILGRLGINDYECYEGINDFAANSAYISTNCYDDMEKWSDSFRLGSSLPYKKVKNKDGTISIENKITKKTISANDFNVIDFYESALKFAEEHYGNPSDADSRIQFMKEVNKIISDLYPNITCFDSRDYADVPEMLELYYDAFPRSATKEEKAVYIYKANTEGVESAIRYMSTVRSRITSNAALLQGLKAVSGFFDINMKPGENEMAYRARMNALNPQPYETIDEYFYRLGSNVDVNETAKNWLKITGTGLSDGLYSFGSGFEPIFCGVTDVVSIDELARSFFSRFVTEYYNGFYTGSYEVANSVGNMAIPTIVGFALNAVAPGVGSLVSSTLIGLSAAGNVYEETYREGYDKKDALTFGILSGASEIFTELLLGGINGIKAEFAPLKATITKVLRKELTEAVIKANVREAASSLIKKSFSERLGEFFESMLDEGKEEFIQEIFGTGLRNIVLGENEKVDFRQALKAGLYGMITAGLLNAATSAVSSIGDIMLKTTISEVSIGQILENFTIEELSMIQDNSLCVTEQQFYIIEKIATLRSQGKVDEASNLFNMLNSEVSYVKSDATNTLISEENSVFSTNKIMERKNKLETTATETNNADTETIIIEGKPGTVETKPNNVDTEAKPIEGKPGTESLTTQDTIQKRSATETSDSSVANRVSDVQTSVVQADNSSEIQGAAQSGSIIGAGVEANNAGSTTTVQNYTANNQMSRVSDTETVNSPSSPNSVTTSKDTVVTDGKTVEATTNGTDVTAPQSTKTETIVPQAVHDVKVEGKSPNQAGLVGTNAENNIQVEDVNTMANSRSSHDTMPTNTEATESSDQSSKLVSAPDARKTNPTDSRSFLKSFERNDYFDSTGRIKPEVLKAIVESGAKARELPKLVFKSPELLMEYIKIGDVDSIFAMIKVAGMDPKTKTVRPEIIEAIIESGIDIVKLPLRNLVTLIKSPALLETLYKTKNYALCNDLLGRVLNESRGKTIVKDIIKSIASIPNLDLSNFNSNLRLSSSLSLALELLSRAKYDSLITMDPNFLLTKIEINNRQIINDGKQIIIKDLFIERMYGNLIKDPALTPTQQANIRSWISGMDATTLSNFSRNASKIKNIQEIFEIYDAMSPSQQASLNMSQFLNFFTNRINLNFIRSLLDVSKSSSSFSDLIDLLIKYQQSGMDINNNLEISNIHHLQSLLEYQSYLEDLDAAKNNPAQRDKYLASAMEHKANAESDNLKYRRYMMTRLLGSAKLTAMLEESMLSVNENILKRIEAGEQVSFADFRDQLVETFWDLTATASFQEELSNQPSFQKEMKDEGSKKLTDVVNKYMEKVFWKRPEDSILPLFESMFPGTRAQQALSYTMQVFSENGIVVPSDGTLKTDLYDYYAAPKAGRYGIYSRMLEKYRTADGLSFEDAIRKRYTTKYGVMGIKFVPPSTDVKSNLSLGRMGGFIATIEQVYSQIGSTKFSGDTQLHTILEQLTATANDYLKGGNITIYNFGNDSGAIRLQTGSECNSWLGFSNPFATTFGLYEMMSEFVIAEDNCRTISMEKFNNLLTEYNKYFSEGGKSTFSEFLYEKYWGISDSATPTSSSPNSGSISKDTIAMDSKTVEATTNGTDVTTPQSAKTETIVPQAVHDGKMEGKAPNQAGLVGTNAESNIHVQDVNAMANSRSDTVTTSDNTTSTVSNENDSLTESIKDTTLKTEPRTTKTPSSPNVRNGVRNERVGLFQRLSNKFLNGFNLPTDLPGYDGLAVGSVTGSSSSIATPAISAKPVHETVPDIPNVPKYQTEVETVKSKMKASGLEFLIDLYEQAKESGESLGFFHAFEEHNFTHVERVAEESVNMVRIINQLNIPGFVPISEEFIYEAGLIHDLGMVKFRDGKALEYDKLSGKLVEINDKFGLKTRKAHPLLSAIIVMQNKANFGSNTEMLACLALIHSKSTSGVRNVTKVADLTSMIREIIGSQDLVKQDGTIEHLYTFDASKIVEVDINGIPITDGAGNFIFKDNILEQLRTGAWALRVGDAHAMKTGISHGGREIKILAHSVSEMVSCLNQPNGISLARTKNPTLFGKISERAQAYNETQLAAIRKKTSEIFQEQLKAGKMTADQVAESEKIIDKLIADYYDSATGAKKNLSEAEITVAKEKASIGNEYIYKAIGKAFNEITGNIIDLGSPLLTIDEISEIEALMSNIVLELDPSDAHVIDSTTDGEMISARIILGERNWSYLPTEIRDGNKVVYNHVVTSTNDMACTWIKGIIEKTGEYASLGGPVDQIVKVIIPTDTPIDMLELYVEEAIKFNGDNSALRMAIEIWQDGNKIM